MKITVLTPIYNRKNVVTKLYDSLVNQTSNNFEWLIIDDGSTDNLKTWVEEIKKDNKIDIQYYYRENGGKHRALNAGISKIDNEITVIVDSDDYLELDAIETIEYYYEKYKNDKEISGFCFLRGFPNGNINGNKFKNDEFKSDYITCRINEMPIDDKAEVYFTKYLKENPFLEIDGEYFLTESYVWMEIGLKSKMIFINKILYIGEYLSDGLSQKKKNIKYESPIGMAENSKLFCNKKVRFKYRCIAMIRYIAYSKIGNRSFRFLFNNCEYKILFLAMYELGILYKIKLKVDYNKAKM